MPRATDRQGRAGVDRLTSSSSCARSRTTRDGQPTATVTLAYDDRHRRRLRLHHRRRQPFLLDLAEAQRLRDGDLLALDDGRWSRSAPPPRPCSTSPPDPLALARIAWHLGNRHTPTRCSSRSPSSAATSARGMPRTRARSSLRTCSPGRIYGGHAAVTATMPGTRSRSSDEAAPTAPTGHDALTRRLPYLPLPPARLALARLSRSAAYSYSHGLEWAVEAGPGPRSRRRSRPGSPPCCATAAAGRTRCCWPTPTARRRRRRCRWHGGCDVLAAALRGTTASWRWRPVRRARPSPPPRLAALARSRLDACRPCSPTARASPTRWPSAPSPPAPACRSCRSRRPTSRPSPPTWSPPPSALVPLGQTDGQRALAALEPVIVAEVAAAARRRCPRRARHRHPHGRPLLHAPRDPVHEAVPLMTTSHGPLRVGIGGPVGSGKTMLCEVLCKAMRDRWRHGRDHQRHLHPRGPELLTVAGALPPERIMGVETGGCPHTAIREDASINLAAVARHDPPLPRPRAAADRIRRRQPRRHLQARARRPHHLRHRRRRPARRSRARAAPASPAPTCW